MSRHAWRRPATIAAILVLLQGAAVLVFLRVERSRRPRPASRFVYDVIDGPAVDLAFVRPDGTTTRVSGSRDGVVVLHFWATWCPPCVDELPTLLAASQALRDRGLELVAVSVDDDWAIVSRYFDGQIPANVVRPIGDDYKRLGVRVLPDTFIVDRDGIARMRVPGARDWATAEARAFLAEALGR